MCRGRGGVAWTLKSLPGLCCAEYLYVCLLVIKCLPPFGEVLTTEETLRRGEDADSGASVLWSLLDSPLWFSLLVAFTSKGARNV